jgi:hypothetical protein
MKTAGFLPPSQQSQLPHSPSLFGSPPRSRARQEFISSHRPKLIVRGVAVDRPRENEPIRIVYSVVNTGETTAHIIEYESTVIVEPIDMAKPTPGAHAESHPTGSRLAGSGEQRPRPPLYRFVCIARSSKDSANAAARWLRPANRQAKQL